VKLALAAAVLAAWPAAAQRAVPRSFFAMSTVDPGDFPQPDIGAVGHLYFAWTLIEGTKDKFDFTQFDALINAARQRGLVDSTNTVQMAVTLGTTPQWAAADPSKCFTKDGHLRCPGPPKDIGDWTLFLHKVMEHYDGKTMPHIRCFEIWNEADAAEWWGGTPADLVKLAQAAYPIIHADPHSMVLTPSVTGPSIDGPTSAGAVWMGQYLDAGGDQFADGGAFHGYIAVTGTKPYPMPEQGSPIETKVATIRKVFDEHGKKLLAGKPIFDTEGSWGKANVIDADQQAAWLARWYLIQAGLRKKHKLEMASWFSWGDPATFTWGTIETKAKGMTSAAIAFNAVASWVVGNEVEECAHDKEIWSCAITAPNGDLSRAVWSTGKSPALYPGATAFGDYRTLDNQTIKVQRTSRVLVGSWPILLEGKPPELVHGPFPKCPPECILK
jgi:hypothetical protein